MNLPNYFLADLPAEAELTPTLVDEACQTLGRNRNSYLVHRSTESLVALLERLAAHWLAPDFHFRKLALELGPTRTGFSRETLAAGLDGFFRELTRPNLESLLHQDLAGQQRLERFTAENRSTKAAIATPPALLVHVAAGNVPNPTLVAMVFGILLRSAQFVKCASGAAFLPRLFAHSLYEADSKLGACLEVAEWRGSNQSLTRALLSHADCVTATGTDETLAAIRKDIPLATRFVGYGHRVSFAYIAAGMLSGLSAQRVISRAGADVVAWNQLGCLSPHVIYVENGGAMLPVQFAEQLAAELARREETEPRGSLPVELSAAIASRRSLYELRAAHSPETRLWQSTGSTAWTVVYETDPRFQPSCLNRFIYVKSVRDLVETLHSADSVRGKVSTVGLAAPEDQAQALATELARWGVSRVCQLGRMQLPPLTWRHDGRPPLGELVTWTDWEQG